MVYRERKVGRLGSTDSGMFRVKEVVVNDVSMT